MKERHDLSRRWIKPCNVGSFVPVAMETGKCKVGKISLSIVLPRDDMVYLKRKAVVRKRNSAILTPILGPPPNLLH
jgi:hypothetical protein